MEIRRALVLVAAIFAAACDDSNPIMPDLSVRTMEIGPDSARLVAGDTLKLTAYPKTADGQVRGGLEIVWTTSDTAIASVRPRGIIAVVEAKRPGTVVITATAEGKSGQARVTVADSAGSVNPVPEAASLLSDSAVAGTGGFTLRVRGRNFVPGSRVHWNGSPRETSFADSTDLRAEILASDIASAGTAAVTVWSPGPGGGSSNALSFEIAQVPVAHVEVSPGEGGRLWPGETVQLTATARDANGNVLSGRSVTWTAENPDVARISPTGVVTAVAPGQASFTAAIEAKSATAWFQVIPAPGYDLLYESSRESGKPELWILSPGTGSAPRRLLPDGTLATDPAVSPDGQRIAYVGQDASGNRDIYVVNRDGTGIRRLTSDPDVDDQPAWSPDGTRLAFRSLRSGYSDIWVMNADGSAQRNLTGSDYRAGTPASERPVWSPDGSRIVFQHRDTGLATSRSVLMTMRPDGSDVRTLSSLAADGFSILEPAFTPDGKNIVARTSHAQQGDLLALFGADGAPWYWFGEHPGEGHTPAISPDGLWIAFAFVSRERAGSCACEIFVTRMDGADRKMATVGSASGGGLNPVWLRRP